MVAVIPVALEETKSKRLQQVVWPQLDGLPYTVMDTPAAWENLSGYQKEKEQVLLFVVAVPASGISHGYVTLLQWLTAKTTDLTGWTGAVIIDGSEEIFTKKIGRELIFLANQAGCAFPGRPLVEATGSLYNFRIQSMVQQCSLLEAYQLSVGQVIARARALSQETAIYKRTPNIVVIHASSRSTSNTLLLWEMIQRHLDKRMAITEISLRNGTVVDCRGCSYAACLHFGESGECFYGGVMVDRVYPAVNHADSVVLLCPNYNDAVSANMMAFFNRLTALFRKEAQSFYKKRLYALVVSGYSGGDIVAEQVLGAMNCNKNFQLPPRFALIETAHDPGSILASPDIEKRAYQMAKRIAEPYNA